jgi:drug/metabolite transporter superfamily protein YnfA
VSQYERIIHAASVNLVRTVENPVPASGDLLGYSVAFVGPNLLVGVPRADMGGTDAGAAYLFDGTTGALLQTFQKPEPAAGDWFGNSVAALGENVLVGAPGDDTGEPDAGAVYLFDGKTGEHLRTFQKPNPDPADWFGASVIAVGENVLAGAPLANAGATDAGAAFLHNGSTGERLMTFRSPTPAKDDWFGVSLAATGSHVVIGAFLDDAGGADAGAAYVFDPATGNRVHTLQKPAPAAGDQFGVSIAANATYILIGAPSDDGGALDAGAAYLFDPGSGGLLRVYRKPNPAAEDNLGASVALFGNNVLAGAPGDNTGKTGAAYLFENATTTLLQPLLNPSPADDDQFGFALAASGDRYLIAAPGDHNGANDGGAAYLFQLAADSPAN